MTSSFPSSRFADSLPIPVSEVQSPAVAPGAIAQAAALDAGGAIPQATWVEVLVDCPGAQGAYTYRIPADLTVQPGDILSVPFGAQQVGAIALHLVSQLPDDLEDTTVRPVAEVVSQGFFPPRYWELLQRVATYYQTTVMQVAKVALPPGLLGRSQRRIRLLPEQLPDQPEAFTLSSAAQQLLHTLRQQKQGNYTWHYLQRQVQGAQRGLRELLQKGWVESYLESPSTIRPRLRQTVTLASPSPDTALTPRQQEIIDVLRRRGGEMPMQELLQTCRTSSTVVKGLAQKGWAVVHQREALRSEQSDSICPDTPKRLNGDQARALATITQHLHSATQFLLHGVTGSGKTEVYLQAIAPVLAAGQSALVLVPEIGLTPQLTDRFRARFGDRVRVYHSSLSDGERYDTWRQMLQGIPQVVIGTRSAVFAPLPHLGLIVLDEEHDSSFKQDQPAPCYHARTVAQWRSQSHQCPLILGSATPSLETWQAAHCVPATAQPLSLPQRIEARPHPPIHLVDMRQELHQGNRSLFSRSLRDAIITLRLNQQQGILFVPRRGHSTFVSCRSCGYVITCHHCDISLTYHQPADGELGNLRCHYCGDWRSHPTLCPDCGSPYLKHFGSGTQRVMHELAREFPDLRCLRFDRDTTRTKGAHRALLDRFARGEVDLLVGTQMLTKGIDLPQVTLVGVLAADGLLHLPDYRAGERTYQVLTQVAGRSGRGDHPGQVILQTYSPEHPVIQAVLQQDYAAFAANELRQRQDLGYPPLRPMTLLRFSGPDAAAVRHTAEQIAAALQTQAKDWGIELLGPAPASIPRMANRYRWQLLVKHSPQSSAPPDLTALRSLCSATVSLTIDVDPLNLL
jgi:primosomal protein N' (replication factor Y)